MPGPEILVVDPDSTTRQLLREFLGEAGFASSEATDLGTALLGLRGGSPAAVVLHDHVPGAQGVEILESLRRHHPAVPIVFIADPGGGETRAAATRVAVAAYVDKPFRVADLLATVVRTVRFPARPGFGRPRRASRPHDPGRVPQRGRGDARLAGERIA